MIAAGLLPARVTVFLALTKNGRARMRLPVGLIRPLNSPCSGRNQGLGPALEDRRMTRLGIIVQPIGGHRGDGLLRVELIESVRQYWGITHKGCGQFRSDDFVVFGIHRQMPLAPSTTLAHTLLTPFPFALTMDFQPARIDHDMAHPCARAAPNQHR